jgi:hypothetical protein
MIESAVNIDVNVNGTQTVQQASVAFDDLGDAVAKTQRQAEELALQFGINDERTQEAIRTAGKYKQQLELLDQAVDAHRGGQETLFRAVQGVGAGFELATGAMALFGSESEELNKVLMKVQGAMIFSQGLKDIKEFAPAMMNLSKTILERVVTAFSTLKGAIAGTGIGVAVIAVGALITKFISLREETRLAGEEQKKYNEQISNLRRERELLTAGEEQFTRDELKRVDARLTAVQLELEAKTDYNNKFLADSKKLGIELGDEDKRRRLNQIKSLQILNEELINEQIKLEQKVAQFDEQRKAREKANAQINRKERQAQIKSDFDGNLKLQQEYNAIQSQQLKSTSDAIIEQTRLNIEATDLLLEGSASRQKTNLEMLELGIKAFGLDFVNTFSQAFEAISALETAYASSSEESQRKAFQTRKALAITQATISTIESAINAFKTASDSPITTAFPAYPFIQAGLATAFGLAKIKEIGKQQFQGSQAPSLSSGGVPSINAPRTLSASSLPQSSDFITADRRVYVLEGDIKRVTNRVNNTQAVSVVE